MRAFALAILAATSYAVLLRQPTEDKKKPEKDGEGDCPLDGDCPFEDETRLDEDKLHLGFLNAAGQMIAEVDANGDGSVCGEEAEAALMAFEEEEGELSEEEREVAEGVFHMVAGEDEVISKEELGGALDFGLEAVDFINAVVYESMEDSAWVDYVIASEILNYGDSDGSLTVSPSELADKVEGDIRKGRKEWADAEGKEVDEDELDAEVAEIRDEIEGEGAELLEEIDLDQDGELSYAEAYVAVVDAYTGDWDLDEIEAAFEDMECEECDW